MAPYSLQHASCKDCRPTVWYTARLLQRFINYQMNPQLFLINDVSVWVFCFIYLFQGGNVKKSLDSSFFNVNIFWVFYCCSIFHTFTHNKLQNTRLYYVVNVNINMWFMSVLVISINFFVYFLPDLDMKKDIDALIAEERAEIISKYDKVTVCTEIPSHTVPDNTSDHDGSCEYCI